MSRGHGRVQLQVLDFLLRSDESARARGEQEAYVSIADIAGAAASRAKVESVRRAVKSLAAEGLILLRCDGSPRPAAENDLRGLGSRDSRLMARLASSATTASGRLGM
jgi:hypothetical protein